jgi:60 kDa SS-A/Ro ribonucleoprotein
MKTNIALKPDRFTHEGAPAKRISWENQLRRSVTACLLWEDTFYEQGTDIAERIHEAASHCSPEFVRDLAIHVRKDHGIRHASLWLAMSLLPRGGNVAGDAIASVVSRADELAEVLAMYWKSGKRPVPNQLKRGLARAFHKFDEYQFAKYNRKDAIRLRDVMFLCHPKPTTDEQAALFKRIADDVLAPADTWERALSTGGDKREEFTRLLESGKLGYLACLRNMRNMLESGVDRDLIEQRLLSERGRKGVLPFQFLSAAKMVPEMEGVIDRAMLGAVEALPKLEGRTAVVVDASGSMTSPLSRRSILTRLDAATGIALMAVGMSNARVFAFGSTCAEVPGRASIALRYAISGAGVGHVTNLGLAVHHVQRCGEFDRVIVITDEQSRDRVPDVKNGYIINVAAYQNGVGYGSWNHIDGFSEQTLKFIAENERLAD